MDDDDQALSLATVTKSESYLTKSPIAKETT